MANELEPIRGELDLIVPADHEAFTEEQWRAYVGEATQNEFDVILEKGKRIREFHIVYWNNRDKWNRSWPDACEKVIGLSTRACYEYEIIHRIFDPDRLARVRHLLPSGVSTLALLAKAVEIDSMTVSEAAENGSLAPEMSQDTARKVLQTATIRAKSNVLQLVREGYTDEQIAERTALSMKQITEERGRVAEQATNLNPEVEGPDVAHEIPTPPPVIPAPPPAPVKKGAAAKTQEIIPPPLTVSPYNAISAEIEALGNVVGEEDLETILRSRMEYPEVFRAISYWDAKFGPLAVETSLKQIYSDFDESPK
jgi:hypothetical protein